MTDNILSTLTPKQKITGIVLVAVIGIIVWQAMGLFGGGGSNATPAPAAPPTQQVGQTPNGQPPNANTPPGPSPQQQIARQLPISSTFLPTENRAIIEKQ